MSSFVVAGQIWDARGVLRKTVSFATESYGLGTAALERVLTDMRPHLKRAIAGETVTSADEVEGYALQCMLLPLRNPEGAVDGALSIVLDVTERNRIETALYARLAFEKQITELSSQFINLAPEEVDRSIKEALRTIGEFTGVDRANIFLFDDAGLSASSGHEWCAEGIVSLNDQLVELPISAFPWWTERLRRREVIHIVRVADLPEEAVAERTFLSEISIKSAVAIPMASGRGVVGFLGFSSVNAEKAWPRDDISLLKIVGEIFVNALDRKRAEEERKLLEAQLVQTRSLENVAKLAGGVAHDFNNLLGVILNYSAMLKRELSDPRHVAYLNELHESAWQAAHLTRQLLLIGRRGVVEPIELDLNEAITSLVDLLRGALGDRIALKLELGSDVGVIRLGVPQIEQVILNLTLNAHEAMPSGGEFTIKTSTVELDAEYTARYIDMTPGRYTLLTATDTGVGMTPEIASRAMEPFFTTKTAFGTGLGLSTVHGIVKQAGGHITLSTAPAEGCTIRLFFPVVDSVARRPAPPLPAEAPPAGKGETILVVEDSPSVRKLVCGVLSSHGYRVLEAATPIQALQILHQQGRSADLLLTDVILPEMSGRVLAERMRELGKVRRVLFMSGYENDHIARHGVLSEGVRLLQKPFLEADLLREVRSSLDS